MRLSVQDNGVGIGATDITVLGGTAAGGSAALQLDAGQRRSGFGLFNIRERLSWLGGDMRVSSHPDGGTLVVLTVPRRAVRPRAAASAEEEVS